MQIHDEMNKPLNEKAAEKNYAKVVVEKTRETKILSSVNESEAIATILDEFEKQKILIRAESSFGFRQIIKECKKVGLKDEETHDLANKLNDIRDTHLHPQNHISDLIP